MSAKYAIVRFAVAVNVTDLSLPEVYEYAPFNTAALLVSLGPFMLLRNIGSDFLLKNYPALESASFNLMCI